MTSKPTPEPVGPDVEAALDHLLEQVVTGFFVLTDGQGNLSKWSEPAEFLFGLGPDEALGEPMFGKLMAPPYGAAGDAWRRFLEEDLPPAARSSATLTARHPEAGEFPVEAVFVPVRLDEGFDFSLFLEDLSFELPMDMMLLRMRQQHPIVIKALRQALAEGPLPWDGWRTAGTLVIFSPKVETPWITAAMEARAEERRRMEEEAQSRIQAYEVPEVQGDDIHDLDDAAAVVERLRWATERIEDLEERSRIAEGAAHEVAEARKRAEAAEQAAIDARAQLTEALTKADAELVATSEAERLELSARLDSIERAAMEAAEAAAEHRITAERERQRAGDAQRQAMELGKRLEALERDLVSSAEANRAAAAERARIEAEAAVEAATRNFEARIEAVERARDDQAALTAAEGRAEASRAELQVRLEALERHQQEEWSALREEVVDLKVAAADATELRRQIKQVGNAVGEAVGLRSEVARTREEVEALRRSAPGPDVVADLRRLEGQAGELAALREQVERLSATAARREELEDLGAASQDLDGLRAEVAAALERLERLSEEMAPAADAGASLEDLRAEAERFRAEAAELREETARLGSRLSEVTDGDDRVRYEVEAVRHEQVEIRALLEEARRERDESRERLADALRQVDEAKAAAARHAAEEAARLSGGTESEIRRRLDRAVEEFESVRRESDAIRDRIAEIAASTQSAERHADEAKAEAAAVREELAGARDAGREAERVAREAAARIDQVDRGAANVLGEVRAQKQAVEDARLAAREAAEQAHEVRGDAAEAKVAVVRVDERLASAEQQIQDVLGGVAEAREAAADVREEAIRAARAAAEEAVGRLREELDGVRTDLEAARREAADRPAVDPEALEAFRADVSARLQELRDQLDAAQAPASAAEDLEAIQEALGALRADMAARASNDDLEALRHDVEALRAEDSADELARVESRLAALEAAPDLEAVMDARLGEMAAELMAARTETESARRAVEDLRHEMQSIREYAATAKAEGASALQLATTAQTAGAETERRVEQLRDEMGDTVRMLEDLRAHAEEARRASEAAKAAAERASSAEKGTSARFTEVWDELIKKSRTGSGAKPGAAAPKPEIPVRDPRPGFDDADRPMAVIGLDGKFKELNPAFSRLIGYDEHEFTKAAWPSVHDRGIYKKQVEAFNEMVAGNRDELEVQSTYMHGQGLMVPVLGRLALVRDDEGAPAHLLLVAEERHHA